MTTHRPKIVMMGTTQYAAAILEGLAQADFDIVGIVCQPPRPANRGKKLTPCPIHTLANQRFEHIPLFADKKLRTMGPDWLKPLKADLFIVAAYGRILPKELLDIPEHGCLNIHASRLPSWRGAAPIHYSVMSGEATTCNTLMQMDEGLDTGDMIAFTSDIPVKGNTTHQLAVQLAESARRDIPALIQAYYAGELQARAQDHALATHTQLLEKKQGVLDFQLPADQLERAILALHEHPGCSYRYRDYAVKVSFASSDLSVASGKPAGTVLSFDKAGLVIQCGQGGLILQTLQKPGGKAIQAAQAATAPDAYAKVGEMLESNSHGMPELLYAS